MDPEQIATNEEPVHAAGHRRGRGTGTPAAFLLMLFGATMIIGGGAGVPWPWLLAGLLIWLVGCLALLAPSL
ncbi:hypothetical protein E2562_021402 [Oryza meyeriana var. granulata]|uniref:Uncharacterized protein n=1 Tax=Oryza meyeriana var. granulata TaxID=110450 RepID=A0A6G1EXL8_9ORYZ|nr:hypothetical protein E2562_021402 [Oryza meyeriana var. granulata]